MTVSCYLLSLSQSVNSPDNREFELSPLQPDEMGCFAPPARMQAAHAMRGNSEHRQKWECLFLCCVCAWLRSSHGTTSKCIFKAPCAAAVPGLCTSFSGSYHFQFHMNNWTRLLMKLAEGYARDLLAEYWRGNWESRCLGRPSFSKTFVTHLRNDPRICCVQQGYEPV